MPFSCEKYKHPSLIKTLFRTVICKQNILQTKELLQQTYFIMVIVELIQDNLSQDNLDEVAEEYDCIINSANNLLLTKGSTGIAGALVAKGGGAIMRASNKKKAEYGGRVPIGHAVAHSGGDLNCGIVHAVGMGYGKDSKRILATPDKVLESFSNALTVATDEGHTTAAIKLMCSRAGYSTVEPEKAPKVMLQAMLSAAVKAANCGLDKVAIFIPPTPIELVKAPIRCRVEVTSHLRVDSLLKK